MDCLSFNPKWWPYNNLIQYFKFWIAQEFGELSCRYYVNDHNHSCDLKAKKQWCISHTCHVFSILWWFTQLPDVLEPDKNPEVISKDERMFAMDDGNYKKKWQIETFALHIKKIRNLELTAFLYIFLAIQVGLPWSDSTMPQIYKWFTSGVSWNIPSPVRHG